MRRAPSSWLVVAAVGAVALLAAVDAFHSGAGGQQQPDERPAVTLRAGAGAPALAERADVARELRGAGVSGTLIFIDEACRYWALDLPDLEWHWESTRPSRICSLSFSSTTRDVFEPPTKLWQPEDRLIAACRRNLVDVYATRGDSFHRMRGCTPAWNPEGTVTHVRRDEVLEREPECRTEARFVTLGDRKHCARVVLARADLVRAVHVGDDLFCPPSLARLCARPRLRELAVRDVAWLGRSRLVVQLSFAWRGGPERGLVAFFTPDGLSGRPLVARGFDDLRVSPSRRYVAVLRRGRPSSLLFFDRRGRVVAAAPIAGAHRVAWSPNERWTAAATRRSVYVFPTRALARFETDPPRLVRIPVFARDLAWE